MALFDIIHALLIGTMCYQFVFMLLQWWVFRRKDYLYYITYMGCSLLFLVTRIDAISPFLPVHASGILDEYLDQPLIIFAFWMYIRFGYHFLDLKEKQPDAYRYALHLEKFFMAFVVVKCVLIPLKLDLQIVSYFFLFSTIALCGLAAPVLYTLLRQKNLLNNFLVMGGVCITLGGLAGPLVAFFTGRLGEKNIEAYIGLEMGVLIELLLLNTGLIIKNKRIQQQIIDTQQKLIGQLQQTDMLRTNLTSMQSKLSADLHDNIGAGLSSIAMYSEIARQKMELQPASAAQLLGVIGVTASEVIGEMKDRIWFIQPVNSTFRQMMDRLRQYAEPLCVEKEIKLSLKVDEQATMENLTLPQKKNIFLATKEAINNAIKHANAANLRIHIYTNQNKVFAEVEDDGIGIPQNVNGEQGNGLKNMHRRITDIDGIFSITTKNGRGTKIKIEIPVSGMASSPYLVKER